MNTKYYRYEIIVITRGVGIVTTVGMCKTLSAAKREAWKKFHHTYRGQILCPFQMDVFEYGPKVRKYGTLKIGDVKRHYYSDFISGQGKGYAGCEKGDSYHFERRWFGGW